MSSEPTKMSFRLLNHQVDNLFQLFENLSLAQTTPQTIKIQLDEQRKRLLESLKSTRHAVKKQIQHTQDDMKQSVKRKVRQIVVGDPDASLRKFVHEPPQVKLLDKLCFAFSILHVGLSEFMVLSHPSYFHMYFLVMSVFLMTFRYIDYKVKRWHYFMFDLCYFINFLCIVQSLFLYDQPELFEMIFIFANGPVMLGIVVWRNSMVFHSVDKMTSLFLHVFPPMYTYCHRWLAFEPSQYKAVCTRGDCTMSWSTLMFNFSVIYTAWQVLYLIKTEILDRHILESDDKQQSSLRWLINDQSNFMTSAFINLFRKIGVMRQDEVLDSRTVKGKSLYYLVMAFYTAVTVIPSKFVFEHKVLHLGLFLGTVVVSILNGANYYIEVFAARYLGDLQKKALEMETKYDELRQTMEEMDLMGGNHSDLDTDTDNEGTSYDIDKKSDE